MSGMILDTPGAVELARTIAGSQEAEIAVMRSLLAGR